MVACIFSSALRVGAGNNCRAKFVRTNTADRCKGGGVADRPGILAFVAMELVLGLVVFENDGPSQLAVLQQVGDGVIHHQPPWVYTAVLQRCGDWLVHGVHHQVSPALGGDGRRGIANVAAAGILPFGLTEVEDDDEFGRRGIVAGHVEPRGIGAGQPPCWG